MAFDLDQFVEEAIEFSVEFQNKTLVFHAKPTSMDVFFGAMKGVPGGTPAMRKTFREFLLDEDQQPLSKEWIEKLLTKPGMVSLGLMVNDGIMIALGLKDMAAKKG